MTTLLDVSGILRPVVDPTGACQAWVESRAARCGKATDGMLCPRHMAAAQRRLTDTIAKDAARQARWAAEREAAAPRLRDRLAWVEAEIARLDPPPPTTDPAAYGGVGSTAASRYRSRYTPDRIHRLAGLHSEAQDLRSRLGSA